MTSQLLLALSWLLAAALVTLVVIRVLGIERGTLLALLIGALPLSLLPAYGIVILGAPLRRRLLSATGGVLILAHLLVIAPTVGAADLPAQAASAPRLRVVTANLYVRNPTPELAGRALRALRPDVLVVPELDVQGLAGLQASGLLDDLPFAVTQSDGQPETVGLFSRLPLRDIEIRSAAGRRLPRATVTVAGTEVRLLAAHPLPPILIYEPLWRRSLRDLAAEARALELPAVVAGDLNADRDHALFRALLDTGLRDAHDERGRGLARTWPASFPVLQLDHVLVRDRAGVRLAVLEVAEAEVPGSDHLAVVADLAILSAQ
ncbi:MAG: endonuclease/exonuclease/phosphatase family protein [Actinomycetota bacterium]|nr:endonuclease/exonuclease/phosphatase family protein [Actinomycetota bacterium]